MSAIARVPRRRSTHRVRRDRWLVSYADFITLLFAFFVVMYALSSVNEHKYRSLSDSLNQAFNAVSAREAQSTQEAEHHARGDAAGAAENSRRTRELAAALEAALAPLDKGSIRVSQSAKGVMVEIGASALFAPADAQLHPEASTVLGAVASVLVRSRHAVRIEGHTDSIPISTPVYPSNWELSAARASAVARLLVERGVQPYRIGVMGYADNRPVDVNTTNEGRARNRRVTLSVYTDLENESLEASPASTN